MAASVGAAARSLGLGRYVLDLGGGGQMAADACLTLIYPFALLPWLAGVSGSGNRNYARRSDYVHQGRLLAS